MCQWSGNPSRLGLSSYWGITFVYLPSHCQTVIQDVLDSLVQILWTLFPSVPPLPPNFSPQQPLPLILLYSPSQGHGPAFLCPVSGTCKARSSCLWPISPSCAWKIMLQRILLLLLSPWEIGLCSRSQEICVAGRTCIKIPVVVE